MTITDLTIADASEVVRTHHPYSPSTLASLEACPCYQSRTDVTNERAIAGTIAHKAVETQEDDARLSDDDAIAVAECLDFVESRRREMGGMVTELKEAYLPIDACKFADCDATTAGYADHILISEDGTRGEIIDWKFGRWAVSAAVDNPQGIAYALGLFARYPAIKTIRVWFKQPLLSYVTEALFTRDFIPALYLRVQTIVERARLARQAGDFLTATPRATVCNFCAHLGRCPKVLDLALRVAKKFMPLDFPADITPSIASDPHNTTLMLNLASVMKVWAEAARRQVTDRVLRRDAPVPEGMRVQEMPGRRQIVDMTNFKAVALRHVTPAEFEKCLDATFGPLETAIADNAPRGSKKAAVEAFQADCETAGAVVRGQSFSFLKMVGGKEQHQNSETQKENGSIIRT